jgi:REP element-mobilizing transposase RayT
VLDCCLHDNGTKLDLHAVVVMPDHVHLIFTPLINPARLEVYSLGEIMDAIKGASAHKINRLLGRSGKVWQTESFDRVLRCSEKLDEKVQYVSNNPVRRHLVSVPQEYPWLWVAGVKAPIPA